MTPENYDPNTNESGDSYQSSHPYGVPEGQRPGPYQHYQQQPPVQPPRRTGSQALAAASMVMAICSFLFMLNMGSLFFGSLLRFICQTNHAYLLFSEQVHILLRRHEHRLQ